MALVLKPYTNHRQCPNPGVASNIFEAGRHTHNLRALQSMQGTAALKTPCATSIPNRKTFLIPSQPNGRKLPESLQLSLQSASKKIGHRVRRKLPKHGPIAQRLEHQTHNLARTRAPKRTQLQRITESSNYGPACCCGMHPSAGNLKTNSHQNSHPFHVWKMPRGAADS